MIYIPPNPSYQNENTSMVAFICCTKGGECGGPRVWTGMAPQCGQQNPKYGPQNWTAEILVLFYV